MLVPRSPFTPNASLWGSVFLLPARTFSPSLREAGSLPSPLGLSVEPIGS